MKERGTTGAGRPQITGVPRIHRDRAYGGGRGEVIPSFDGTDFRQYERWVRLFCVQHTSGSGERGW